MDAGRSKLGSANLMFAGIRKPERWNGASSNGPEIRGITKNVRYRWKLDNRDWIVVDTILFVKVFNAFKASIAAETVFIGRCNLDANCSVM